MHSDAVPESGLQADRIIVIDNGTVAEQGPHDALMRREGTATSTSFWTISRAFLRPTLPGTRVGHDLLGARA